MRAVAAWALCGSYGWDRLVTAGACSYEPGAFQVVNDELFETPYAEFLRAVGLGTPRVVDGGWWRSSERLLYGEEPDESPVPRGQRQAAAAEPMTPSTEAASAPALVHQRSAYPGRRTLRVCRAALVDTSKLLDG